MRRTLTTTMLAMGAAAALVLPACGDDDSADDTTTTEAGSDSGGSEGASGNGEQAAGDEAAFCDSMFEADTQFASDEPDPEAAASAADAVEANAPAELEESVATVLETARAMLESEGETEFTPEFEESLNEVYEWMGENCGFQVVEVVGQDYSFEELPETVDAGPTMFKFVNEGTEAHELSLARINDDVDASVEELVQLPEEEAMSKITQASGTFAVPGGTGWALATLEPGRWAVTCFVPEGATMENLEAIESGEMEGGQPHSMLGMVGEFTVA